MERNINYPNKKFKIIYEYNYNLIDEDDDELDLDMDDEQSGEDIDSELGLEDNQAENVGPENEVEIDVTDIISKQDEILSKFDEVIASINGVKANSETEELKQRVSQIDQKIDQHTSEIKKELIKRNPTPNEKLKVQAMNSYPYNLSLSDYWKPADDENEEEIAMSGSDEKNFLEKSLDDSERTYQLSVDDIENDYSETDIRNSLDI